MSDSRSQLAERASQRNYDVVHAGGIFAFHMLGAVKYLSQRYDLTHPRLEFLGASAGSLVVTLAACGVSAGTQMRTIS